MEPENSQVPQTLGDNNTANPPTAPDYGLGLDDFSSDSEGNWFTRIWADIKNYVTDPYNRKKVLIISAALLLLLGGIIALFAWRTSQGPVSVAPGVQNPGEFPFADRLSPDFDTTAYGLGDGCVALSWETQTPTDGRVYYGLTESYGFFADDQNTLTPSRYDTEHSVVVCGLDNSLPYNFRATSQDSSGNLLVSGNIRTAASDSGDFYTLLVDGRPVSHSSSSNFVTSSHADGTSRVQIVRSDRSGRTISTQDVPTTLQAPPGCTAQTSSVTVTLTRPTNNATLSGTADMEASVAGGAIAKMFFMIGSVVIAEDTTAPYAAALNTVTYPNGGYLLRAVGQTATGECTNWSGSGPHAARVTIRNSSTATTPTPTTPPPIVCEIVNPSISVTLTRPANNSTLSGTVTMEAQVTATAGKTVDKVMFYVGQIKVNERTTAPYTRSLNTAAYANGAHVVRAVAHTTDGECSETGNQGPHVANVIFNNQPPAGSVSISMISHTSTANSITVTWQTSAPATSVVEYGTTTSFGQRQESTTSTQQHSVTLSNLSANTRYYMRLSGQAAGGVQVTPSVTWRNTLGGTTDSLACNTIGSNAFFACFYEGRNFETLKGTATVASIDYTADASTPIHSSLSSGINYSAKWHGRFFINQSGAYRFRVIADDGARLYINNQLVIDEWRIQAPATFTASRTLSPGNYTIRLEFYQAEGGARAYLAWERIAEDEDEDTDECNALTDPTCDPLGDAQPMQISAISVTASDITANVRFNVSDAANSVIRYGTNRDNLSGSVNVSVGQASTTGPNRIARGHLDSVSCSRISGWAYDPDNPSQSVEVWIYASRSPFFTVIRADQARPDVNSALNITGSHGFSWSVPASWQNVSTNIAVKAVDLTAGVANVTLGSGVTLQVNCAPPPIPPGPEESETDPCNSPDLVPDPTQCEQENNNGGGGGNNDGLDDRTEGDDLIFDWRYRVKQFFALFNASQAHAQGAPRVSLISSKSSLLYGESFRLTWSAQNTDSCSASWTTSTATSGNVDLVGRESRRYEITCTAGDATVTDRRTVRVIHPYAQTISGLQPRTTYYYKIESTGIANEERTAESPIGTFTTSAAQSVNDLTSAVTWTGPDTLNNYGVVAYSRLPFSDTNAQVKTVLAARSGAQYAAILTGLSANTTYYYQYFNVSYAAACAAENETCTFSGGRVVIYGAHTGFSSRYGRGSIPCNNTTFGDPWPGVIKHCYTNYDYVSGQLQFTTPR